jgi:hypothetical protein
MKMMWSALTQASMPGLSIIEYSRAGSDPAALTLVEIGIAVFHRSAANYRASICVPAMHNPLRIAKIRIE